MFNYVEAFHHKLNCFIWSSHPRVSILVEKLTDISIEYYRNYVNKLFAENATDKSPQNIFNDIFNFLKSFLSKYDKTINIKLLLQDEDTEKSIDEIS